MRLECKSICNLKLWTYGFRTEYCITWTSSEWNQVSQSGLNYSSRQGDALRQRKYHHPPPLSPAWSLPSSPCTGPLQPATLTLPSRFPLEKCLCAPGALLPWWSLIAKFCQLISFILTWALPTSPANLIPALLSSLNRQAPRCFLNHAWLHHSSNKTEQNSSWVPPFTGEEWNGPSRLHPAFPSLFSPGKLLYPKPGPRGRISTLHSVHLPSSIPQDSVASTRILCQLSSFRHATHSTVCTSALLDRHAPGKMGRFLLPKSYPRSPCSDLKQHDSPASVSSPFLPLWTRYSSSFYLSVFLFNRYICY